VIHIVGALSHIVNETRCLPNTAIVLGPFVTATFGGEMHVGAILKTKGRAVTTARPETPLHEVASNLAVKKIGAVVIVGEAGRVVGILSERDLVRAIAERGQGALTLVAGDIMTRNVTTCTEERTLDELMELMTAGRFRHVPVVENDALVGLISIGDVVKYHLADMALEVTAMRSYLTTG
jgi:CBS domain-containing protein